MPLAWRHTLAALALLTIGRAMAADQPPILIADFEGPNYGNWKVEGDAFGASPARGTLPNQMPVSGFLGQGLVNTYLRGDSTTGTLTSPEFRIDRRYVNFLCGGGNHPGETCITLVVEGKVVRSTSGLDSEQLDWETWPVADLMGKSAQIVIVDNHKAGWGHINVDQIFQDDNAKAAPIEAVAVYEEPLRPQFHFTARKNWLNDPNGLVYYDGEYHLFFQHNPDGINWGNMTWGHAVSPDLVHWKQLDNALLPDRYGTMFSGSAVVDWNNTAGFQRGGERTIVCLYTAAGGTSAESKEEPFTQCCAYSNDRGRTWTKYEKNPVLGHIAGQNRDPKVIWHEPSKQWVMALYLDGDKFALFGSPNLKEWSKLYDMPGFGSSECPDFFEIAVDGNAKIKRWIFWGGDNQYLVGTFDGKQFTQESGPHRFQYGSNYYAAQTYSDIPATDGRRIQIAWMRGGRYPRMPFNQQMSFPTELVLKETVAGLRVVSRPVKELELLHGAHHAWSGELRDGENPLQAVTGELFDIRARIDCGAARQIRWLIRGTPIIYDVARSELTLMGATAVLRPENGKIDLQVLIDRSSIEVFGNGGEVAMATCFVPPHGDKSLSLSGSGAKVESLEIRELKSSWLRECFHCQTTP